MIIESVKSFVALKPTWEDVATYEVVECKELLHYFSFDEYGENLGKMCFLCSKKLVIDTTVIDSSEWGKLKQINGLTVLTWKRLVMLLAHFGFIVKKREWICGKIMHFEAERMPRVDWDDKTLLNDYPDSTVVKLPLTHSQFRSYWTWPRTDERKTKEMKIFNDFKLWYFAPLTYCKMCERIHDGGHRWQVARLLGLKEVYVRIMNFGRSMCERAIRVV